MSIAIPLHLLSAVIWVGGMFFAYMILRPVAASLLEPPHRLPLWSKIFEAFFKWVWVAIVTLLATGYWMVFSVYGGMANVPLFVHIMNGLGIIMMLIFLHVFFAPSRRLKRAIATEDWPAGARALAQIRVLIALNTALGLLVIAVASGGRYLIGS
ncbi:MAG: CopD family protein [Gammaproteobacteria bacterium]|nr:MAG: CopD family protein [Gammaproteobacteria bacterium]